MQTKPSAGLAVTVVLTGSGTGSFQTVNFKTVYAEIICHTFIVILKLCV